MLVNLCEQGNLSELLKYIIAGLSVQDPRDGRKTNSSRPTRPTRLSTTKESDFVTLLKISEFLRTSSVPGNCPLIRLKIKSGQKSFLSWICAMREWR